MPNLPLAPLRSVDGVDFRQANDIVPDCPLGNMELLRQFTDFDMPFGAQFFHNHIPAPSRQHVCFHLLSFRSGTSLSSKAGIFLPLLFKFHICNVHPPLFRIFACVNQKRPRTGANLCPRPRRVGLNCCRYKSSDASHRTVTRACPL